jgi:hypothetical protein
MIYLLSFAHPNILLTFINTKHEIMAKASKKSPFLKAAQKGDFQNNAGKPGAVSSKATFTMKSNPARKKG